MSRSSFPIIPRPGCRPHHTPHRSTATLAAPALVAGRPETV